MTLPFGGLTTYFFLPPPALQKPSITNMHSASKYADQKPVFAPMLVVAILDRLPILMHI